MNSCRQQRRRALGNFLLLICGAALFFGCATGGRAPTIAENFSVVVAGTNGEAGIYCSGTPTAAGWEVLRAMGIRKSVNLDTVADPAVKGIVSRWFPLDDWQQIFGPVGPQLEAGLNEIGPGTIVHCRHGSNRSRTLIILYRVRVCGWTVERAIAEADKFGWGDSLPALKRYIEHQRRDAEDAEKRRGGR